MSTQLSTTGLRDMLATRQDFLLVNTLPADKFEETKIADAVNIPQAEDGFVDKVEQRLSEHNQPVVVYCASEDCDSSTKAAKKLDDAGFTNVFDYTGGAQAWQEQHA